MDDESAKEKLVAFLNRYSSSDERPSKIANLVRYLDSDPSYEKPIDLVPLDQYERRLLALDTILQLQRKVTGSEGWQFTRLQFSVLMMMPLASLESFSQTVMVANLCLQHFEPVLKRCKYVLLSLAQVYTTDRHQS